MSRSAVQVVIRTGAQMLEGQAERQRQEDLADAVGTLEYLIEEIDELKEDPHTTKADMWETFDKLHESAGEQIMTLRSILGLPS